MVIASLDGYIADASGNFDWAEPDEEVHTFVNEIERPIGTYLFGRRLYEVMTAWETLDLDGQPPFITEFARIWRAADKVVYSKTLAEPLTRRTRIERDFEPAAIREMKDSAKKGLSIGGPGLAAQAIQAGLVDDYHLFFVPVLVGGGKPVLPPGVQIGLELVDQRRFANGTVYLRYRSRE